ncbi:hypothetical protein LLG96_11165 [bacterium]|nr:hypothetical protein [bacterium]
MNFSRLLKNTFHLIYGVIRYNLKIIFANKFLYFLLAAVTIFVGVTVLNLVNANSNPTEATGFWLLLVPGILLVFYPTAFGIQNDIDTRMIEILFGIPNYRYKIWLVRLMLIFLVTLVILTVLTVVFSVVLKDVSITMMVFHIMFPVIFTGSLAFMFSTIVRNGNGTAIVMVIIGIAFWIAKGQIGNSEWFLFLNPYNMPANMNEAVWQETVLNNRMYLFAGTVIAVLYGLFNLQNREKFI